MKLKWYNYSLVVKLAWAFTGQLFFFSELIDQALLF